jgi:hypothetical protein
MSYTTVTKVRQVAGFVGNTNVTDAMFSTFIIRAESMINSRIGDVYTLPLPKFYFQTIVFSGTGSGTDTLTITIDGVGYDVAITLNLTASEAADLFRAAASASTSFATDGVGAGATVTIYNLGQDSDSTDVTITSTDPQTVAAITATGGTVTETSTPFIESIATQLAAALALIQEYGPEAQGTDKDGWNRLSIWEGILKEIQNKSEKLFDFSGTELPKSTSKQLRFYPTAASEDDDTDPTAPQFTMNKEF